MARLEAHSVPFVVDWVARLYFGCPDSKGQPTRRPMRFVDAMTHIRGMLRIGDPTGDRLEKLMQQAEERERITLSKYRYSVAMLDGAAYKIMAADIAMKSPRPAWDLYQRMMFRRSAKRAEWKRARAESLEAAKRYSGYCQGVLQ